MEIKILSGQPKIEGRTVAGIAAVFGNVDSGGDRLHRGAFKKTLSEGTRRFKHLWQHDYNQPPVAVIRKIREIEREEMPEWITKDNPDVTGGLLVEREYLETPRADEILTGIKSGAISEMSFGYDAVKVDYEAKDGKTIRNLKEVRLYDTSDVVWGMNSLTAAAKAGEPSELKAQIELLTNSDAPKAAKLAACLQLAAGALMGRVYPESELEELDQQIKHLVDLLAAEPQSADELKALTEQVSAMLQIHEHQLKEIELR